MRMLHAHHPASLAAFATCVALALTAGPSHAQNPISSKIVGSDVARRNRNLIAHISAGAKDESTKGMRAAASGGMPLSPVMATKRLMAAEVAEYLRLTNAADTLPLDADARWSKMKISCVAAALGAPEMIVTKADVLSSAYLLELLCNTPELGTVVPNGIRLALWSSQRSRQARHSGAKDAINRGYLGDQLGIRDPAIELVAYDALDRVLRAIEKGHTNPQRFYVGGQLGMRLVGGEDDNGIIGRASVRAAYFIPISPFAYYQLPVVTNLGDIAAAAKESQKDKLGKLTTSSEGAFLSIEPTLDPVIPGPLKDLRLQFFGAVGGQINTLRDKADTSNVQVAQGRYGVGANIEIGNASNGHPNLFLSTRLVGRQSSAAALQRVFGSPKQLNAVLESFALIPIGAGVSILGEVSATRGSAPVVRIALWSQATPQKGTQ